jgi:hypothetical protein
MAWDVYEDRYGERREDFAPVVEYAQLTPCPCCDGVLYVTDDCTPAVCGGPLAGAGSYLRITERAPLGGGSAEKRLESR